MTLREAAVALVKYWDDPSRPDEELGWIEMEIRAALAQPEERGDVCACGSQDMTGKVLTCVGGEGFHSREKCDPPPSPPEEPRQGTGSCPYFACDLKMNHTGPCRPASPPEEKP